MPGPRDYKPSEVKRLYALSNNECFKPGCNRKLIAEDGFTVVGKICHIEAARKGGPRFNDDMSLGSSFFLAYLKLRSIIGSAMIRPDFFY